MRLISDALRRQGGTPSRRRYVAAADGRRLLGLERGARRRRTKGARQSRRPGAEGRRTDQPQLSLRHGTRGPVKGCVDSFGFVLSRKHATVSLVRLPDLDLIVFCRLSRLQRQEETQRSWVSPRPARPRGGSSSLPTSKAGHMGGHYAGREEQVPTAPLPPPPPQPHHVKMHGSAGRGRGSSCRTWHYRW